MIAYSRASRVSCVRECAVWHILDFRFVFGIWWWQLFPHMSWCLCVFQNTEIWKIRAEDVSVRIDKHFKIKCQAWMRMFGTNIYILHTLWWRKERQPAHKPHLCVCMCANDCGSGAAEARCYCVCRRKSCCSQLAEDVECECMQDTNSFGVKKRFYFKLHFVRSLCATLMPIWDITSASKFRCACNTLSWAHQTRQTFAGAVIAVVEWQKAKTYRWMCMRCGVCALTTT